MLSNMIRSLLRCNLVALSLACLGASAISQSADRPAELPLMPMPAHIQQGQGQLLIDGNFDVKLEGYTEPRLEEARHRFLDRLARQTGIPVWRAEQAPQVRLLVKTGGPSAPVQKLEEDESYHLAVTPDRAELSAANPLGILRGLQTVLQLIQVTPQGFALPAVTIDDKPRFAWRGLMIDGSRHFMPIPVLERNLDGMEAVKLNVFHWHLSENQGYRAESKVFPLLQQKGSDGQFYTQAQMKHVVEYARARGIRVVPEFDMPCHTTSWFVGYPQLASAPGPYEIERKWGIFDPAMDPSRESTFQFIDRFVGEMTALFPDPYFHIGGDECNGKQWDANPKIQAFMRQHGFKDNAALQAYFTERVQKLVTAHHKIMEGWDEVLQPNTPKDVVIQSWRGPKGLADAARQGNPVILSNGYYIDLNQPASLHYLTDPLGSDAADLTPEQKARVMGGEAAMWSEFATPENIDNRIWPRTAAIAERLWSAQDVRDLSSMYYRMTVISRWLEVAGLQHKASTRMMLQRMSGEEQPHPLEVLSTAVQPPLEYQRGEFFDYNSFSPLNHMVDAVPPESDTARLLAEAVSRIVGGSATPDDRKQVRAALETWRDNDSAAQPLLQHSAITLELVPLSHDIAQVASIGLRALDAMDKQGKLELSDSDRQFLKQAETAKAALRNMLVSPVEQLVAAASK